jgi:hypothetical protein
MRATSMALRAGRWAWGDARGSRRDRSFAGRGSAMRQCLPLRATGDRSLPEGGALSGERDSTAASRVGPITGRGAWTTFHINRASQGKVPRGEREHPPDVDGFAEGSEIS